MSATLEADKFASYFGGADVQYVSGRQHPVKVWYTPTPEADFVDATLITILQIHLGQYVKHHPEPISQVADTSRFLSV
eukprot:SAG31_NODE_4126_length_3560_cov_2.073678_3_plen_78_part_00